MKHKSDSKEAKTVRRSSRSTRRRKRSSSSSEGSGQEENVPLKVAEPPKINKPEKPKSKAKVVEAFEPRSSRQRKNETNKSSKTEVTKEAEQKDDDDWKEDKSFWEDNEKKADAAEDKESVNSGTVVVTSSVEIEKKNKKELSEEKKLDVQPKKPKITENSECAHSKDLASVEKTVPEQNTTYILEKRDNKDKKNSAKSDKQVEKKQSVESLKQPDNSKCKEVTVSECNNSEEGGSVNVGGDSVQNKEKLLGGDDDDGNREVQLEKKSPVKLGKEEKRPEQEKSVKVKEEKAAEQGSVKRIEDKSSEPEDISEKTDEGSEKGKECKKEKEGEAKEESKTISNAEKDESSRKHRIIRHSFESSPKSVHVSAPRSRSAGRSPKKESKADEEKSGSQKNFGKRSQSRSKSPSPVKSQRRKIVLKRTFSLKTEESSRVDANDDSSLKENKENEPVLGGLVSESEPIQKKRRWGSSKTIRSMKKPVFSISTDSLKELIPGAKPVSITEVQLDDEEDDDEVEEGEIDQEISDSEQEKEEEKIGKDKPKESKKTEVNEDKKQIGPVSVSSGNSANYSKVPEESSKKKNEKKKEEKFGCNEEEKDKDDDDDEEEEDETEENGNICQNISVSDILAYARQLTNNVPQPQPKPTRKISILSSDNSDRPPTPAKNKTSNVLFITNLVRPFTIGQLKELLARTGKIVEGGFWIDKIKSKCYVEYSKEDEADETRHALHGVRWPVSNPKVLCVDFAKKEDMELAQVLADSDQIPRKTEPLKLDNSKQDEWKQDLARSRPRREEERRDRDRLRRSDSTERNRIARMNAPVREWDVGKLDQMCTDVKEVKEFKYEDRNKDKKLGKKDRRHSRSPSVQEIPVRKMKKKEEDAPAKLLDDLFKKTKTTPCIYWLPLTSEQIAIKEEMRRKHMAEHERRMAEMRKAEKEREKARLQRQSKRTGDRDKRRRSRSRSQKK